MQTLSSSQRERAPEPARQFQRTHPRVGGFTLVELLVVLAIIAILAVLLFPAIQGIPAKAQQAKCVGNMRMMGAGFAAFAGDNNGETPYVGKHGNGLSLRWEDHILPYVDAGAKPSTGGGSTFAGLVNREASFPPVKVFDCPSLANGPTDDEGKEIYHRGHQYHMNGYISATDINRIAKIKAPSKFIIVIDRDSPDADPPGGSLFAPWRASTFTKNHILPHGDFNALYADGHVRTEKISLIDDYKAVGGKYLLPWGNETEEFQYPNK